MARTLIALAAAVIICVAGWAITAPVLIHLVGVFDKRWTPADPEGLGYIFYSFAAIIMAALVWVYLATRVYAVIKHRLMPNKPSPLGNPP